MTREQFIRDLRKEARELGLALDIDTRLGKGSHYRISLGGKVTTLKSGELSRIYAELVRKQLGLPKRR